MLGQDGKVLFIKYGNFIRRVPLDLVIPADEYHDTEMDEIDKQDVENRERMEDDDFKNVDVVTQKDKEIDQLKKSKLEQDKRIADLEH